MVGLDGMGGRRTGETVCRVRLKGRLQQRAGLKEYRYSVHRADTEGKTAYGGVRLVEKAERIIGLDKVGRGSAERAKGESRCPVLSVPHLMNLPSSCCKFHQVSESTSFCTEIR